MLYTVQPKGDQPLAAFKPIHDIRTKVPSKRRKSEQPTLFPGYTLHYKVHKVQYATQIVGEIYEKLSHAIVGKQWIRLIPEGDADVRPDLGTSDGLNYVESKSCQHRMKVTTHQLSHYVNLVEDHSKLTNHCNVNYFFWQYGNRSDIKLVADGKTVGGLINLLLENTKSLHIIHWSIVKAMWDKLPKGITHHSYPSWKISTMRGRPFEVMQFGEPWFRRLRENPAKTLKDELGLDPELYTLKTNYCTRRAECSWDGCDFVSSRFAVHRYVPNKNYVPFPEFFNANKEVAPF